MRGSLNSRSGMLSHGHGITRQGVSRAVDCGAFGKKKNEGSLDDRIASGEFDDSGSTKEKMTRPLRKALAKDPLGVGRALSFWLAKLGIQWRRIAAERMPTATGDIREIVGQPVFIPLYSLFRIYGKVFRLSFGPKSFVIVSDSEVAKHVLLTNANNYSKGLLSEILDFVMGTGLIPADGEIWKVRRRAILPALHKKYIDAMITMFGESALHGSEVMKKYAEKGEAVEMENFFSRLALDIIGKAVFNYEFDSLTNDDPVIKAVYTVLREAEYRSTYPIPYWNVPPLKAIVPRQRECDEALNIVTNTLNDLIAKCKKMVEENDEEFVEEFLSKADPSILHFLIASGDQITSKQLRDDLMTLLIAGHETTAAVLTWTMHCIVGDPDVTRRLQEEADEVLGDRLPTLEDLKNLKFTTRVINEAMRLYPQPPVLIRRALDDDVLGGYKVEKGSDLFISVWNLHRNPGYWTNPDKFDPDRFPIDGPMPNEVTEDYRYLPFGGGKRKCIGDQFALFESAASLAVLMRRFDFSRPEDAPEVGMTTGATIHTTNGLYLKPTPRTIGASSEDVSSPPNSVPMAMAFTEENESSRRVDRL
ncbi:Protein LUTEIN DEFICIENT 5 [Picochlorum sp. SENEW3]|nr:Protein LUTEIN DEFICIENT 5 [Picochlorum sp. SENEW3]WPT14898.1 Protein LUTEIN DEFICIENT 5 [Picochlorum sp. SENEW3]